MSRKYVCAECGGPVSREGTGLGTWHCPRHPSRMVTVIKDLSAGKEGSSRMLIKEPVQVQRHTRVRVIL